MSNSECWFLFYYLLKPLSFFLYTRIMTDLDGNDALLQLLTESWDEQQTLAVEKSKWTRDYLTRLTSLPLDELLREPDELRVEQEKMRRDAQQLAFNDYPAFIHANTCRQQVDSTLDDLQDHLNEFLTSVPDLLEASQGFASEAQMVADERAKITHVLEHQNVLVDLLEIPQLMETCVWNGYYSEAMDLASHVRLLLVRYPLPIVKSIQQQVQASADLMLVQLIAHLRQPIKLAAAMNVIGHLRRMDVFESEVELRMVFLRCRHDYLTQRLDRIKAPSRAPTTTTSPPTIKEDSTTQQQHEVFEYMKRYIDVMREQMFEIATQYMSVFSHQEQQSILILSDYMVRLIDDHFEATLKVQLPKITDTSSLASLLTQIQYCGMSLGRIGLDFRHLFVRAFEDTIRPLILQWIDKATEEFISTITTDKQPSAWMSASSRVTSTSENSHQNDDYSRHHPNQPPMLLVNYPPLAIYTNAILSAFNALRLLPAVSLLRPIQSHLDSCFLEIGSALKHYADDHQNEQGSAGGVIQSFVMAYVRCCVPFLKGCLVDVIYGNIQLPDDGSTTINNSDLEALLGVESKDDLLGDQTFDTETEEKQNDDTDGSDKKDEETIEDKDNKDEATHNEEADATTKNETSTDDNADKEAPNDKVDDQDKQDDNDTRNKNDSDKDEKDTTPSLRSNNEEESKEEKADVADKSENKTSSDSKV
ncbi:Dor1-like family-domain-containing protein [Phascolomyces articulosus]|uniref:Conserved oligomeric Golgi complex subunit 8 n=1 Tax=Phascolomyces articulosus TaxID=60185 RepID=A0AAD5K0K9_9FUNG|nr:Dor1-like family-domain-containing protein [Phascolomyces articulosus]